MKETRYEAYLNKNIHVHEKEKKSSILSIASSSLFSIRCCNVKFLIIRINIVLIFKQTHTYSRERKKKQREISILLTSSSLLMPQVKLSGLIEKNTSALLGMENETKDASESQRRKIFTRDKFFSVILLSPLFLY